MKKYFLHLKTILIHKWYVMIACWSCGLYWEGLIHDLSKFSPTEFLELGKYYKQGTSPVNIARSINGVSKAWLHHKGHNKHHWQYWVDFLPNSNKGVPMEMDEKSVLELICDWVGAGKAYSKNKWSEVILLDYWNKYNEEFLLHEQTRQNIKSKIDDIQILGFNKWANKQK
jgi:hypothetical protein